MAGHERKIEEIILTRLLRLNATIQGAVTGTLLGLAIFVETNWLILKAATRPVVYYWMHSATFSLLSL